jgi:hypothetical protein
MLDFDGKVVIVTGAAQGMGYGVALELCKNGAVVCMLDKNNKVLSSAEELNNNGYKAYGYVCDVTDKPMIKEVFENIVSIHGSIHKLANVAGISANMDFLSDDMDRVKDLIFNVNFNGIWNTCRAAIPYMIGNGKGSIVNYSSVTGNIVSDPGMSAYSASKGAVSGLTKALAMEFADRKISVNAILPGYIWTDMLAKYNPDNPQIIIDKLSKGIPMGRLGSVKDAGCLTVFLLSDEAEYITGQEIVMDGAATIVETKEIIKKGEKKI